MAHVFMRCRRVLCEGNTDGEPSSTEEHSSTGSNDSKKSSKAPRSRGPFSRFIKSLGGAKIFGQSMYRVMGNVGLLLLLGHLLPFGGRSPLTGEPPNISVEVSSAMPKQFEPRRFRSTHG